MKQRQSQCAYANLDPATCRKVRSLMGVPGTRSPRCMGFLARQDAQSIEDLGHSSQVGILAHLPPLAAPIKQKVFIPAVTSLSACHDPLWSHPVQQQATRMQVQQWTYNVSGSSDATFHPAAMPKCRCTRLSRHYRRSTQQCINEVLCRAMALTGFAMLAMLCDWKRLGIPCPHRTCIATTATAALIQHHTAKGPCDA